MDHCGIKELHDLVPYVDECTAMLFSESDAFEISGILASEKSPAKAKAGQIAPSDIEVKAGPTELIPGPDISALSAVGLAPKVENGKIAIMQDKIIVKEGEEITEAHASIMAKLDIIPFEVGVEPIAAYMDGEVYADIKIDKDAMVEAIMSDYAQALPFAVEIAYPTIETIDFILGKAGVEGNAIDAVIDEGASEEVKAEESSKDDSSKDDSGEPSGEPKAEEIKEDNTEEVKVEESAEAASE